MNGVIPGYTTTNMTSWVDEAEEQRRCSRRSRSAGPGTAEEVAAVMLFLASDEASYVTGAVWAADGGMTAV